MIYFLSRLTNLNKCWFKQDKPWLIVGKGKSFDKVWSLDLNKFYTFGLNHVCEHIKCDVGHFIDLNVISPEFVENSQHILTAWHPHVKFRVSKDDLNQWTCRNDLLAECVNKNKLYYYYSSTYKGNCPFDKEIVKVKFFSGEVPFYLLGLCGIQRIFSLGIDGGTEYSSYFKELTPLQNGRQSFDESIKMIERSCIKFGIEWIRL